MKVKVFDYGHEDYLTKKINEFIEQIEKEDMEVVDIKYSSYGFVDACGDNDYGFTALVMYRPMIKFDCDLKLWDEIPETLKASCTVKEEK